MTAGNKVLFLSVKKDTGMERKILWLIGSKNLKAEWQKERKRVENGKFLRVKKIQILRQQTILHQQKRKRKSNVSDIINRHSHLPRLPAIQVLIRNCIMTDSKLSLRMKKLNGNYPKVWPITQKKYFEEYVPEDSLKEAVLWQNPVPDNYDNVKKFDDFLRDILKEKRKTNEKNIENVLKKLQRKIFDAMGPLPKLWNILERAKGAEEDAVQISTNDLLHYVKQTVLLLGQSSNAITYHRRMNVLGSVINCQYQVKSMLKEKASLLQKHDEYLFGKKFRNHIADTIKSKK